MARTASLFLVENSGGLRHALQDIDKLADKLEIDEDSADMVKKLLRDTWWKSNAERAKAIEKVVDVLADSMERGNREGGQKDSLGNLKLRQALLLARVAVQKEGPWLVEKMLTKMEMREGPQHRRAWEMWDMETETDTDSENGQ